MIVIDLYGTHRALRYPDVETRDVAIYNKLVRDRIPEIIETGGGQPVVRILGEHEYLLSLQAKLIEEFGEFLAVPSVEEFADIVEVLRALAEAFGYDWEEVEADRTSKRTERGGFDGRVFLEEVLEPRS